MSNKSKLNNFKAFEMNPACQDQVQGGNYGAQIDVLNSELKVLQQEYISLHGRNKKAFKQEYLVQKDVSKCEIERLTSLDTGGNGDGVW